MAPKSDRSVAPTAAAGRHLLRRAALVVAWLAALGAAIWGLGALGHGDLAPPPLRSAEALSAWFDQRDTPTVAFALLRLVAVAAAWYLLAVTVAGLVVRAVRIPRLVALTDLATITPVRRFLSGVAGLGLTASAATVAFSPMWTSSDQAVEATVGDEDAAADATGNLTMVRLPDGSTMTMERLPDGTMVTPGTATMHLMDDSVPTTWTIVSGDHLWGVAETTLERAWARPPTDPETTPYWQAVIELNRARLADPANPDLVYPGQIFDLPPTPPAPPPPS